MIEIDQIKSDMSKTDKFLIENYKKCTIHKKKQLIVVRIDEEQDQHQLECVFCVYQQQQRKLYLPLELIIDSDDRTIFKSWPIYDDTQIYQSLLEFSQRESFLEENLNKVKVFFKEFKAHVMMIIEQKESEILQNVELKSEGNANVLNEYNILSQKKKLKDIVLNHCSDLDQQDKLFKELIRENKQNLERNQQKLADLINTQTQFKVDLSPFRKIKEDIIAIVKSIDTTQGFQSIQSTQQAIQLDRTQSDPLINQSRLNSIQEIPQVSQDIINQSETDLIKVTKTDDLVNCKNFKNVEIDFKKQNIGLEGATNIASSLQDCQQLQSLVLNLEKNQISNDVVSQISSALQSLKDIKCLTLILKATNTNDQQLKEICKSHQNHQNFEKLELDLSYNSIKTDGAITISNLISRVGNISNLSINLKKNYIDTEGVKKIVKAIKNQNGIKNLILNFNENNICNQGASSISSALEQFQNISELKIALKNNRINFEGAEQIVNGIKNRSNITRLSLNFNQNQISNQGALAISNLIQQCSSMIELKIMIESNLINAEGAKSLGLSLDSCQNITNLKINLG
ncbi:hypothetical protein ABPG73_006123, partial [Tetrahymena malaccensis]